MKKQNTFMKIFLQFAFLFSLIIILSSADLFGQNATIRGSVIEKVTGQPILYTNVYLKGTSFGAVTDVNGYFTISKVPQGDYILTVSYIGFDTLSTKISITKPEQIVNNKLVLERAMYQIKGATISAQRQTALLDPTTSVIKVSAKAMNRLPTIGGQADLAQYLQVVPGVVFTGDQGGQLYIRGGTPVQNLVLLDGMTVYNPFHSIGLFSVFDADLVSNADVYTGGFGAQFGGRISSVMDVTTRYGNPNRFAGKVDVNTFGAKILLEGPLLKAKDANSASITYVLSAKKSYIDRTSQTLYKYVNDGNGLPFTFADFYGKVSFNGTNGNRLDIFGFDFNDQVSYQTINNYEWHSYGGGMKFSVVPGQSPMLLAGHVSYSDYKIELEDGSERPRTSQVGGFNMGLDFTYFLGKNKIIYGVDMKSTGTDFTFVNASNRIISQHESTTEIAAYIGSRMLYGSKKYKNSNDKYARFIISPGLRLHYYASLGDLSIEPRLALKYNVTPFFRIKGATGVYSQNIISTASDRDVVNLFYGYVSGPENLQDEFDGEELTHKLQKSTHAIIGFEVDINNYITINFEAYYKWFTQLTNLNKNKIFEDNVDYIDKPDVLKKDFIIEEGNSKGFDVSVKFQKDQLYFWGVYSLGFNERYDGIITYTPHFDRRHNLNLLTSYTFGKQLLWDFNIRWNYGSGFPFTPTAGNYEILDFNDGISSDYTTANGDVGIVYGSINSKRLPSYHRMDIGVKRKFYFNELTSLEVSLSITNIYNRANIFYIDRITNQRVDQLPFMPSLGLNFKF
ncbi:MAG: TonB-dependent receptor [Bacteroidetes bacterium]|nr:MAG: TonB-dependent receptor [Bacteroidota bacterium]